MTAGRKSRMASRERTFALGLIRMHLEDFVFSCKSRANKCQRLTGCPKKNKTPGMRWLALLHVFFDAVGLAHQVRNVLVIRLDKPCDHLHVLLEFDTELDLLLIPPRVRQVVQLVVKGSHPIAKIVVEFL